MQEREAKPRRSSPRVVLAVLLLATSGLALPLTSFGIPAASAVSAPGTAVVPPPTDQLHGKVVLDGVPSAFTVASAATGGSHEMDEFGASAGHPASEPSVLVVVCRLNGTVELGCFRTQRLGFLPSSSAEQGQGFGFSPSGPSGAVLRAGFAEVMLVPTPLSTIASVTASVPKAWWDFSQRRSKFEIYVEMLELMKRGPMSPFEVAFYARLNHKRTKEYAEFLAQAGYLQAVNEDGRAMYALTKDGLGFLERVQSLLVGPGIIEVANPSLGYERDF